MNNSFKLRRIFLISAAVLCASACDNTQAKSPFDADGALTNDELHHYLKSLKGATGISDEYYRCIESEAKRRADIAGDPENVDPKSLHLPEENWMALNKHGKRLIFGQIILGNASEFCITEDQWTLHN
jgi:hypothetical protein